MCVYTILIINTDARPSCALVPHGHCTRGAVVFDCARAQESMQLNTRLITVLCLPFCLSLSLSLSMSLSLFVCVCVCVPPSLFDSFFRLRRCILRLLEVEAPEVVDTHAVSELLYSESEVRVVHRLSVHLLPACVRCV